MNPAITLISAMSWDAWRWPLGQQVVLWLAAAMVLSGIWTYGLRSGSLSWPLRGVLLGLRLVATAALVWMLMGPAVWKETRLQPEPPEVILLTDVSASMHQRDVSGSGPIRTALPAGENALLSRLEALGNTWLEADYLRQLLGLAKVQAYYFDTTLRPASGVSQNQQVARSSQAMGTNLFESLDRAIRGSQADAAARGKAETGLVLLLSDGHDTQRASDPVLLARLRAGGWPVFTVPVGSDQRVSDIAVLAWAESDFVLEGQGTMLHAAISQRGFAGRTARVDLLLEGQLVESRPIVLGEERRGGDGQVDVKFEIHPKSTGQRPLSVQGYQIAVTPLEGEEHLDNNQRWIFLQVSRQQMKIALFEAQPYWDTRFLAQVLRDDPQVSLVTVYGLGQGRELISEHGKGGGLLPLSFPIQREQLEQFDVIILGKGCEQFFPGPSAQLLVDYVRNRGGALVFARGRAFDLSTVPGQVAQATIAAIEPVQWGQRVVDQLSLSLAPAGRRSPLLSFHLPEETDAILTRLPDMIAATHIAREKAASVVLLTQSPRQAGDGGQGATGMAALAHQNAGAGQVLAVLSDGMWQWAFLPSSLKRYDSIYQQFWARTVRWLSTGGQFLPGQSVSLTLSRLSVSPHESVQVSVAARYLQGQPLEPRVFAIAPDGSRQEVGLGQSAQQSNRWTGQFTPQQSGVHVVELLTPNLEPERLTARLAVYDQTAEVLDPSARPQTLKALSAATGGQSFELTERERFLEHLREIRMAQVADRHLADVFDRPTVLVVLMLALALEWLLRRRQGLL